MKVLLRSSLVICSLFCLPLQAQTLSTVGISLNANVVSVGDGDTILIEQQNGKRVTIRLACIDAPETAQSPWGKASSLRLKQLLPVGQPILERSIEKDKYGRTVSEIFIGSKSINLQMVQEGQAVVYKKYLNNCNQMQQQYLDAEVFARQQKLGFWNQTNPQMPWDFRHGNRSTKIAPLKAPISSIQPIIQSSSSKCSPAYPDVCIPPPLPDLNCKDIPFRRFRVLSSDPHHFDRDRDGIGCER